MVNLLDLPLMEGELWLRIMEETALPLPAAQTWPARGCPGGNLAEHGSQALVCICVTGPFGAEVTFTWKVVRAFLPVVSVATTSSVCVPVDIQMRASTVL